MNHQGLLGEGHVINLYFDLTVIQYELLYISYTYNKGQSHDYIGLSQCSPFFTEGTIAVFSSKIKATFTHCDYSISNNYMVIK